MAGLTGIRTILFDLNGTLARDYDRFGLQQDYHATYRRRGGRELGSDKLRELIDSALSPLILRYRSGPFEDFPDFRHFLADKDTIPEAELLLIEDTVADHEVGRIPDVHAATLRRLAEHHRLGIVSDLWAPSRVCRDYLRSTGVESLFGAIVFSCDVGAVKPSRTPFLRALDELDADPASTLFVGDTPGRDIVGAAACGMRTVLVADTLAGPTGTRPDLWITDIAELPDLLR